MEWILFGLACLIILIIINLSIKLFKSSLQREDLIDQNRILQSEIQELKDEKKDLTDQNKDLKNINENLIEKIMLESKLENKNSGISNDENRNNMVRENTGDHEGILVNADINKDLSISRNCSYQVNNADINKDLSISRNCSYQINKSVLRIPGKFRQRLEKLEKKQQISQRKSKYKVKNMSAPKPIYEDVKEDEI